MSKRGYNILLVLGLLLTACGGNSSESKSDKGGTSSEYGIMIQTKSKGKLLFDSSGKQVGDSYKSATSFTNGTAIVENDKGEKGMITSDGDMVVDFGEYKRLNPVGYLYQASNEDNEDFLLDLEGEVITPLKDADVDEYGLVTVQFKDKVIAYDKEGEEIKSIKSSAKSKVAGEVAHGIGSEIGLLTVDKETFIFDMATGDEIDSFKSDKFYSKISFMNDWVVLTGEKSYKVYRNLKPIGEVSESCDSLSIKVDALVCKVGNNEYVLDDTLKKGLELMDGRDIHYQNSNNYVESTGFLKDNIFYENGKAVKTVSGLDVNSSALHMPFGIYPMTDGKHNITMYNGKGELISQTVYSYIDTFDANGYAKARIDDLNHIIDVKGKKVSDEFDEVAFIRWGEWPIFYKGSNADGSVVYDTKMKQIYKGDMIDAGIDYRVNDIVVMSGKDANKKAVVYNVTTKKEVYRGDGEVFVDMTHFKVTEKNKTTYYTLDGVKFFEE